MVRGQLARGIGLQENLLRWSFAAGERMEPIAGSRIAIFLSAMMKGKSLSGTVILFDINSLKETESALQTREQQLLGIIETIPSMLWSTVTDRRNNSSLSKYP